MPDEVNALSLFCPYVALFRGWPNIYWDNLTEYWLLFVSLAFYMGTTVLAVVIARRLKFHQYDLKTVYSVSSALLGLLFFWSVCFLCFLRNWELVATGKAPLRDAKFRINGEVYLYAALWTAICTIVLAIALPSMLQSPRRAREATAVTCLRNYASAQSTLGVQKSASTGGDTGRESRYCDNFRNLYYGKDDKGNRLVLIAPAMADAFAGPTQGTPTPEDAQLTSVPYQDYVYLEDPYVVNNRLWENEYGLVAYPVRPQRTGYHVFWIASDQTVLKRKSNETTFRLLSEEESPLHPEGRKLWKGL